MSLFNNVPSESFQNRSSLLSSSNNNNTAPSVSNNSSSSSGGGLFSSQGTSATGIFGQSNQTKPSSLFANNSGTTAGSTGTGGLFGRLSNNNVGTASSTSFFSSSNNTSNNSGIFASSGSSSIQTGASLFQPRPTVLESAVQKDSPVNTTDIISSPPKLEYSTTPEQIKALFPRMLKNQSTAISKFTISNEFGKIEFEGNRDIKEKDLDALSGLKQKIELLLNDSPVQLHTGEKLDKPVTVTLYNCFGERGNNNSKKYEEVAKKMGYEFLEYDEGNRILKLKAIYLLRFP